LNHPPHPVKSSGSTAPSLLTLTAGPVASVEPTNAEEAAARKAAGEAVVLETYATRVATLTAPHQGWETFRIVFLRLYFPRINYITNKIQSIT
jgi:hypothetical protein